MAVCEAHVHTVTLSTRLIFAHIACMKFVFSSLGESTSGWLFQKISFSCMLTFWSLLITWSVEIQFTCFDSLWMIQCVPRSWACRVDNRRNDAPHTLALVRHLPSMNTFIITKICQLLEPCFTWLALVGPFPTCLRSWARRVDNSLKNAPHILHLWGLSSVWLCSW